MPILGYSTTPNEITFKCISPTFPRHINDLDPSYDLDWTGGSQQSYNSSLYFKSYEPGLVTVDYGDGTSQQYSFSKAKSGYIWGIKSLYHNGLHQEYGGWDTLEDGTEYIPVNPHTYSDGKEEHIITMSFTNKINSLVTARVKHGMFPILNLPDLSYLSMTSSRLNGDIPDSDKIGMSVNIQQLIIGELGLTGDDRWKNWPEGFLKLTKLKTLSVNNDFDFRDLDNNNFRSFTVWKDLEKINWNACGIPKYVKEFNDMPNLTDNLSIAPGSECSTEEMNSFPDFSEVEKINPKFTKLYIMAYGVNNKVNNWKEGISGKGLENIVEFNAGSSRELPFDKLPGYIKEMRSLKRFDLNRSFSSQQKADTFVNSFYEYVTSWNNTNMSATSPDGDRNQFWALSVVMYESAYKDDYRPSGTLQAPSGFVQGSSNGSPSTPMEKIYVLTNNYKQVWTIKPETNTQSRSAKYSASPSPLYKVTMVEGRIYIGSGDLISPEPVYPFDTLDEAMEIARTHGWDVDKVKEAYEKQFEEEGGIQ